MIFNRENDFLEKKRFESIKDDSKDYVFFQISVKIYEIVSIITNISISIIIIFILILNVNIIVSEQVVSNLIQIATSFGALSLAIPLFLKDFKIQRTLWISFLMLAVLFIFSTILGLILVVFFPLPTYNIQFTFFFVLLLLISLNIRTFIAGLRLKKLKKKECTSIKIKPAEIYDFIGVLIIIMVSVLFSKGIASPFFIMFFYTILILLTVIVSSIITALTTDHTKDLYLELKYCIQKIIELEPQKVFSVQEIIDELRNNYYKGKSEQISRTSVHKAILSMDSEIDSERPIATIYSFNKNTLIIPRWNDKYKYEVLKVMPKIIFFKSDEDYKYDFQNIKSSQKEQDSFILYLSLKSSLSFELLKDGNVIGLLATYLQTFNKEKIDLSQYGFKYNNLIIKEAINNKDDSDKKKRIIDRISYFSSDIDDDKKREMINRFVNSELNIRKMSIKEIFLLAKKNNTQKKP